jgi:secondary thiamine-phosphate synthase enzyme
MESFNINTKKRREFLDITNEIKKLIKTSNIKNGICIVFVPHTTCGLTINENADPSVREDILLKLKELIPENTNYSHIEGNSDAHISSSLLGHSLTLIIENADLKLGTWQGIYLCEFDGPRNRQVWIETIKK